ncbi:hypothetical protein C0J52_08792 [Blattella germanica]|nr:hypothetical protein C0J52_08792 [Blattella germanica]
MTGVLKSLFTVSTDQNKETRKTIASTLLQCFNLEGEEFLERIVTGDETLRQWLRNQDHEFYHTGIHALVKRWIKSVEKDGDYIEK